MGLLSTMPKVKKSEKKFKKGVDNWDIKCYTSQAVAREAARWSLKIEQREESTKHRKYGNIEEV